MSGIAHDTEITGRLLLALLLASGLHLALLFGVPADWWALRHSKPPRFEVVLLPPAPVPAEPVRETSIPAPTAPAATAPPPIAQPPEPAVPTVVPPPTSKPVPEPVESAQSPTPVTRIAPTVAAKPSPPPKRLPPSKPKPPSSPKQQQPVKPKPSKPKPSSSPTPARKVATKPPATPMHPSKPPVTKPAAPKPTRPTRAPAPGETRARGPLNSAALLGQIASLDTEIQQQANAGVRSRRVNLADTRSMAGFYAADWARKVTRVGEMNFPDAARRLNLSAGPLLEVAIRADGSLREVRILRSSGNAELDQAARRIVKLAAPYPPFPAKLRRQVDLLRIESPWRFDPGGRIRAR